MALPSSSPRLPSPPPPAEIQIGPKSPGLDTPASRQAQQMELTIADANSKRRIHPGTKAEYMAAGPPLVPLNELDSAFQLQEHLAALHYHHTASNTQPITRETATYLATPPPGIDRTLWLYELCRFLIAQCNSLIVGFLFDTPPCSQATCPEMRASEWQFLCAVHDQPKSCCAIDYCCHTLDWAANVVTNPKIFPSRFVVLSEGHDKSAVLKNLVNVFRRLHRIFAHAWFQHRGVFWNVEAQTGLYVFFKSVCDFNDLLPAENYKLPPEAEGLEPTPSEKEEPQPKVTAIAKPPARENGGTNLEEDERNSLLARRSNTARHSSRPSTGSAVTTVMEEREDENADMANKMKVMHISAPETVEEESEVEVPVIVEGRMLDQPEAPRPPHPQGVVIDVREASFDDSDTPEEGEPLLKIVSPDGKDSLALGHGNATEETTEGEGAEPSDEVAETSRGLKHTSVADFAADGTAEKSEPGSDSNETVKADNEDSEIPARTEES
ncbi:Mob1/phocein [Xylariales sp. AK1849]|nr:Mob1/phocein [Xylariales sp. AK1849]